ncbi:MAG: 1-acyl-sn-glycerol-3-phosphate acyltransferase [Bdellovibrionales bacterium]|nr:1-acyl-sn-glycerol-3-phosphate acyltransferase [Bdellovibrionales bacterium]
MKRLLTWYFNFLPVPSSFSRLVKGNSLPVLVTQSSSVIVESALASFARRSGCHLENISSLKGLSPQTDTFYFVNIHKPAEVAELTKVRELTLFSTLNIFRGKGPVWSHPSYTMKLWDFIALLLGPPLRCRFLLIIFGEPNSLLHSETSTVHKLTRQFKLDYYSNLKIVRGTPFQKFSTQERIVLGGHDYEQMLQKLSKTMGVSERELHGQAKRAFRLIAARPRAWFFIPAAIIVRFILNRLFTDIQVRGLPRLARALKKDTIVLVPMHRSHLDYMLIGQVLYDANLNPPIIAAGVNLSFWPAGWIIRTLGGYFVKRNASQDRLHAFVLRRYVGYLVKRGHLQEFFIEGGRSRSGRMRPPKLGLLKTMVNAYIKKERKDVLFVPVSISYEHVIEDTEYAKENTGSEKIEENLVSLFRARNVLRQKYKEVIIHFGEAIRFSEYREQQRKKSGSSNLIEHLALEISRSIEGQTSIGLRSLTYLSLCLSPTYGLPRPQLQRWIKQLVVAAGWYREMEGNDQYALPTPALERFLSNELDDAHDFYSGGVTQRTTYLGEELFFIPGNVRYTADFYKNSLAHVYLPLGILSTLNALKLPIDTGEARPLYELLRHDFLLPDWEQYREKLCKYIAILEKAEILELGEDGLRRFSNRGEEFVFPGLLLSHLECLLWIYRLLETEKHIERAHPHVSNATRRVYDYNMFVRAAQQQLRFAKYAGQFTRTEIASLAVITGVLEGLSMRGIISFQEQYGKKSTLLLEELPKGEIELLTKTHDALLQKMREQSDVAHPGEQSKKDDEYEVIQ